MSKKVIFILVLSLAVLVFWIGNTVYDNLQTPIATNTTAPAKYLTPLDGSMHLDVLKEMQDISGNIKVPESELTSQ